LRKSVKKKLFVPWMVSTLVLVSFLSGCFGPVATIRTVGWEHLTLDGTAVKLKGDLNFEESSENWKEGFVWDTEYHEDWSEYPNTLWADEFGAYNSFFASLYELDRTTSYNFRAIGQSLLEDRVEQGENIAFRPGLSNVITNHSDDISSSSAVANGWLKHLGGAPNATVWFEYGTSRSYLDLETDNETLFSAGDFISIIEDLEVDEYYYYRAVASNDVGIRYGNVETLKSGVDYVETRGATEVGMTSALLNGRLNTMDGTQSVEVWFIYGDQSPYNLDNETSHITLYSVGDFSILVEDLDWGTTYWFQAVAIINGSTYYGDVEDFTTLGTYLKTYLMDNMDNPMINRIYNRLKDLESGILVRLGKHYTHLEGILSP